MEFPSDYMENETPAFVWKPAGKPPPPRETTGTSPTSPASPITKFSTAPALGPFPPARSNTFAVSSAHKTATTPAAPKKTDTAPARRQTVSDKKANRLTRTLSRMFTGKNPRASRAPLAIKTDLEPVPAMPSPHSPNPANEEAEAKRKEDAVAAAAAALEGTPEPKEPAKAKKSSESAPKVSSESKKAPSLTKIPSKTSDRAAPIEAPQIAPITKVDTASPASPLDAKPASLQRVPSNTGSATGGEPQNAASYEKRSLPPIQTQTQPQPAAAGGALPDVAKIESLASPLSPGAASAPKHSQEGELVDEKGGAHAHVEEKKKKKSGAGFFSMFRMKRKTMAPQPAQVAAM